jgi:hypothetical protein
LSLCDELSSSVARNVSPKNCAFSRLCQHFAEDNTKKRYSKSTEFTCLSARGISGLRTTNVIDRQPAPLDELGRKRPRIAPRLEVGKSRTVRMTPTGNPRCRLGFLVP